MPKDTLVGIRLFGGRGFGNILPKFVEMHEVCIKPYADTLVVGDNAEFAASLDVLFSPAECPTTYAEDMLAIADERSRVRAIEMGYKKLIWQDVDCLYPDAESFQRLISHDLAGVGALTSARGDSSTAIARRFIPDTDGDQEDIPAQELLDGIYGFAQEIIPSGFPGAGALCLRVSDIRDISWDDPDSDAVRWYDRVAAGRPNLCLQEQYCLWMIEKGRQIYLDTKVRVWHVDEDNIAGRYPGESIQLEQLSW